MAKRTRRERREAEREARAPAAPPPEPEPGTGALWLGAAGAMVLVGAVLRALAARGDLWLDEIWSIEWARKAGSFLGVFTNVHVDNNHYLNTLFLRALG